MAPRLEELIYQSATSMEEYNNSTTLEKRLKICAAQLAAKKNSDNINNCGESSDYVNAMQGECSMSETNQTQEAFAQSAASSCLPAPSPSPPTSQLSSFDEHHNKLLLLAAAATE